MKNKTPLAVGDRVRVRDVAQTDGREVSDTGTVKKLTDTSVFVKHDNWLSRTADGSWYLRKQCRRLRPRPAKEERELVGERTERWIVTSYNGASWWIYSTKEQAEASRKNDVGDFRVARVVEIFPGEVLVDRAKLEEKWKRVVSSHINFRDQSPDMPVCQALAAALGLPAKGQP